MKTFVSKFKQIDRTKKIVILFITISFAFIIGFGFYNSVFNLKAEPKQKEVVVEENKELNQEEKTSEKDEQEEKTNEVIDNVIQENASKNTSKKSENKNINQKNTLTKDTKKQSSQSKENQSQNKENENIENNQNSTSNQNDSTQNIKKENQIFINMKVVGVDETMMSGKLDVDDGTSVYQALVKLASQKGKTVSGSSSYVTGIGGLYEKDYGPLSGWMYKVNNVTPNKSAGSYKLSDGDNVVWYYVNYE